MELQFARASTIDLWSGRFQEGEVEDEAKPPTTLWGRFVDWLPYKLAYSTPPCGPCETNALSQEGAYSKGGLISQISGTVLSKH